MRGAVVAAPLVSLALIPTAWIEGGPPICLSRLLLDVECWGCGLTRAFSAVLHGDLARAWAHNRGIAVFGPLLVFLAARWVLGPRRRDPPAGGGSTLATPA